MNLSTIKHILAEREIRLTRSLGQNFLHDANQLAKIVSAAAVTKADSILEIGPGFGALTELLVKRAGRVLAIEKDRRLYAFLEERFAGISSLELLHGDALEWLRARPGRDWSGWKVVSNLPYSTGSPMLVELTQAAAGPELLAVTLQLEVAERAAAPLGSGAYGILSLLIQLNYQPQAVFKISRRCFFPEPEVDSACLILRKREAPLLPPAQAERFRAIVKESFGQRRKMMFKLLKQHYPEAELRNAWKQLGLSEQTRAEEVSLEQFAGLANALAIP